MTYYDDTPGRFCEEADYYNQRRGSKFQNLHFAYQHWGDVFEMYGAVLVMDDDIVISGSRISRLFDLRERYDLWAVQPAFGSRSKISHPVTRVDRRHVLRFTNFIEMTCPLFRRDKLDAFMAVYDPELVGWGCDWWFLEVMGRDLRQRIAIVDAVPCINPHDHAKGGREIDRLLSTDGRKAIWERIKMKYRLHAEERGIEQYGGIPQRLPVKLCGMLVDSCEVSWIHMHGLARRAAGYARRRLRSISPLLAGAIKRLRG